MVHRSFLLFLFLFFIKLLAHAQSCTTLGQNPSTAFPVCGTTTFTQNTVPICSSNNLFVPGCSGSGNADYENKNPFWYKFTCFLSGTLSFVITPLAPGEDYDWQLYDITNRDPNEVYTNGTLVVTGNWSGSYGPTGASASGVTFIQCASVPGDNRPTFARSPQLIEGHQYLLLVSHYSDTQSGYTLSFGGGTAVITDPKLPKLLSGQAACDGQEVRIKLNKNMKCSSLAANGSDFTINSAVTSVTAAVSAQCSGSFDHDSLILSLSNPLPPGTYKVKVKRGNDNNTLLDNCDREIPVGDSVEFTVYPLIPTPMDSLTKPGCSPSSLQLVFKKPMRCNSIAANGSDFTVTGPTAVTVSSAAGTCSGGLSSSITVQLAGPLQVGGIYTIRLNIGSDGNTILDECGQQTPAGSFINFTISDTVNADFTYNILYGCEVNTVQYNHPGANSVNSWLWSFDGTTTSTIQNPLMQYAEYSPKTTTLIVSNGVCSDTSKQVIVFDNYMQADFEITSLVCPEDNAIIKNTSDGNNITQYEWTFGNGSTSNLKDPPSQVFSPGLSTYNALVVLKTTNSYGCSDTAMRYVKVVNNCYIAVPSAFTPNGDGLNDFLYPLNAYKALDLSFSVYNRFGQRLFFTRDWTNKWDGKFKGQGADPGAYVWILTYTHADTGQRVEQKGTTILIRQ